ncbi:Uncharacterised protein [Mycobacteroides abscessus subsp. abscessus]|nr:Uncharacterised protein [Mycobacteroides abscessus subsp. abscessus]
MKCSTATAVARTSARVCGEAMSTPPVRSRLPSGVPDSGSCIGTAVHDQGRTSLQKCSLPRICTSRSSASAVPGALVPTARSLQSAPGTKFIAAALRPAPESPSTQSSAPSAAVTPTSAPESAA